MTTSATHSFLSEIVGRQVIPLGKLAYLGARLSGLIHQAMIHAYFDAEKNKGYTRKELAHRIGKKPEQITRWLSSPANLTLESVAHVLAGMGLEIEGLVIADLATGNQIHFPVPQVDSAVQEQVRTPAGESREVATITSLPKPDKSTPVEIEGHAETPYDGLEFGQSKAAMYG